MRFIKIIGWVLIIASAFIFIFIYRLPYNAFVALALKITHYNKPDKITALIPPGKYKIIQLLPLAGLAIGLIVILCKKFITHKCVTVSRWTATYWSSFKNSIRSLSKEDIAFLLLIILANICIKLWLLLNFPITYDEAWTYLNFTQKGLISSISYYPAPNNHIFYSLLTNLFSILPVSHAAIVRLPAFFANCFFILLLYLLSRKRFSSGTSMMITALCSFLYPVLYYGFTGRGYTFILLFFLITYHLSAKIINAKDDTATSGNLFLFSICSILGFYTMPSFLYSYITLYGALIIWAIVNKRLLLLRKLVYWGIFTVMLVMLLYIPVFIVSGVKSVTSNSYVHPIPRAEVIKHLLSHFKDTYSFFFSFSYALVAALAICAVAFINKTYRSHAALNCWIIMFALLIPILHSVIPFPRTWVYLIVPIIFSLGIILESIKIYKVPGIALAASAVVLISGIYILNYRILQHEEQFSMEEVKLCSYLQDNNVQSAYIEEPLTDAYVLFAYGNENKKIDCYLNKIDSNKAEVSIYKKEKQASTATTPIFTNNIVAVYKNK